MNYFIDTEFLEGTQKKLFGKTNPTIDLISIGIVCEDGREYYAISKDFNLKEAWNRWQPRTGQGDYNNINPRKYWLRDNVLKPIFADLYRSDLSDNQFWSCDRYFLEYKKIINKRFTYKEFKRLIKKYGKTNKQIAEEVYEFCKPIEGHEYLVKTDSYEQVNIGRENSIIPGTSKTEVIGKRTSSEFYGYFADYDWVVFCWLFGKMNDLPKGFPYYCIDLKQTLDEKINNYHVKVGTIKKDFNSTLNDIKSFDSYPKQTNEHHALADARWNKQLYEFLNKL